MYEDEIISFSIPDGFKLTRAKRKWGQYGIEKKRDVLIVIDIISDEFLGSTKQLIKFPSPDEFSEIEYLESVAFGENKGIGQVARLYDQSHSFYEKLYRYLFFIPTGGMYIEISSYRDFEIDAYEEFLRSIKVNE